MELTQLEKRGIKVFGQSYYDRITNRHKFECLMDAWSKADEVLTRFDIVPDDEDDPYVVIMTALKVLPKANILWDIAVNQKHEQYSDDEYPIFQAELEMDERTIRENAEIYFGQFMEM